VNNNQTDLDRLPDNSESPSPRQRERASSLRLFVRLLFRWRNWIIGSVAISCGLAVLITTMTRRVYQASTIIELNKGSNGEFGGDMGQMLMQAFGGSGEALQTDLQTETTILQGDSLGLAVIQKLNLAENPEFKPSSSQANREGTEKGRPLEDAPITRARLLALFHRHLLVTPLHGTRLIRVSYQSHDPKLAATIANTLIDSYKAQFLKSHYEATSEVSDWLTGQLSDLKANVQDSEKKLAAYEKKTGILSLNIMTPTAGQSDSGATAGIHSVVIEKLDAVSAELTTAEANRIQKEAIYRLASSSNGDALIALASSTGAAGTNPSIMAEINVLAQLRTQEASLKMSLAQDSVMMGKSNRHIRELQTQIAEVERQTQAELPRITRLAHADLQLAEQTEHRLRGRFEDQQAQASKLNEEMVEFAVLNQEAFSSKQLYEHLYTRLQEANVAAGIKATNITIVDTARAESHPIRPALTKNLEIGLALGLIGGLILAISRDRLDNSVVDPLELEEITGFPVIGVIPTFGRSRRTSHSGHGVKSQRHSPIADTADKGEWVSPWILKHPKSAASEAFRYLRTAILLARAGGGIRILVVTSCVPEEGKSTVVSNLAISFAQFGKKVLIIQADMRRPIRYRVDASSFDDGLSSVLAGTRKLDEALMHGVHVPTLDLLLAGPRPPMPSEILGSAAFDELLNELRTRYDLVIIDTPPALVVTDAVSIASKADATIWITRAGAVTPSQLSRASQIIERNDMRVIGFVCNRLDESLDPFGSYYGYAYGSKYNNSGSYYEEDSDEA
jgi:polysaccharide biosynthesis transport protein